MKIFLKTLKQEEFEFELPGDGDTGILDLKKLIEEKFNYDHTKIKLLFNGIVLKDEKTLNDYKVQENFKIVMSNLKPLESINATTTVSSIPVTLETKKDPEEVLPSSVNENACEKANPDNLTTAVEPPIITSNEVNSQEGMASSDDYDPISNEEGNIQHMQSSESSEPVISGEKEYSADIKAEDAIKIVASIMKVLCAKNPEKAKEYFQNLEYDNPEIKFLIKKNEEEFKAYLYSPITDADTKIFKEFYRGQLTPSSAGETGETGETVNQEGQDIKKLMDFGFTARQAKDAYYVCDKNFELALNYLLEGNNNN